MSAPGSTAHSKFRTLLAFRPLSKGGGGGGGGVRNRGRISPTAQMSAPGSAAIKVIPDPPRLSPFKLGGGSGIINAAPSGHDRSARINGARAATLFSAALCLAMVDPPPVTSLTLYPLSLVAMCRLSIPPLWPAWPPLLSITHSSPATHPLLSTSASRLGVVPSWTPFYMAYPPCPLNAIAPTISHVRPSSLSVVPDGSIGSLPHPEMLSWPNLLQSQEAVIEAVGGG
jgi:hypothetical protein